jgi:hypothetical protein
MAFPVQISSSSHLKECQQMVIYGLKKWYMLFHDPKCNPVLEISWKVGHQFFNIFCIFDFLKFVGTKFSEIGPVSACV